MECFRRPVVRVRCTDVMKLLNVMKVPGRVRAAAAAVLLGLGLVGCDSSDSQGMPLALYEGELGEACVRFLMETVPDSAPGVPKSWTVVLGEVSRNGFEPASVPFLERFQEGGRRVISASVLEVTQPDQLTIDPELRVAVTILQLRLFSQRSVDEWDVELAWAYKKFFQRIKAVAVLGADGVWVLRQTEVLEGNWPPEE
jgi:hypothetical protein